MNSSIESIVQSIQDSRLAMIKLVDENGEYHQLECIFKEDAAPHFYLVFPPATLPESIDFGANHPVVILEESTSLSLNTTILEKRNDRTLYMVAKATIDPATLREYFRINTSTQITVSYRREPYQENGPGGWSISGHTQDMSGSGVLALLPEEPKNDNDIAIEIHLPQQKARAHCTGHIVRKKRLRHNRWQVSFHFDQISSKHRDAIITYLLGEQRRQLRENVRSRGV